MVGCYGQKNRNHQLDTATYFLYLHYFTRSQYTYVKYLVHTYTCITGVPVLVSTVCPDQSLHTHPPQRTRDSHASHACRLHAVGMRKILSVSLYVRVREKSKVPHLEQSFTSFWYIFKNIRSQIIAACRLDRFKANVSDAHSNIPSSEIENSDNHLPIHQTCGTLYYYKWDRHVPRPFTRPRK